MVSSFPSQFLEPNSGSPAGTRAGKEETRARWGAVWWWWAVRETGGGSRGGGRVGWGGQNVSLGTQQAHFSRQATPKSSKESSRPSSFVSVRFQWPRGAASAGCPRAFPGRLGPLAVQTEPTNKAPAGEGPETPRFPCRGPPTPGTCSAAGCGAGAGLSGAAMARPEATPRPAALPSGVSFFLA